MPHYATVQDFFTDIQNRFDPELTQDVDASIQLNLTGTEGRDWFLKVQNRSLSIGEGTLEAADVTMTLSAENWLDIVNGNIQAPALFMQGHMQIDGDIQIAVEMASWFHLG